jgi:hypothetical protein
MMGWAYSQNAGDKECIQNFGGETPWIMSTLKINKEIRDGFQGNRI